jgi:phenylacetate-CoA ligase
MMAGMRSPARALLQHLARHETLLKPAYAAGALFPTLLDPIKFYGLRRYRTYRAFLDKSQWWSAQELARYQGRQLRTLLAHAYTAVPHYRRVMRAQGLRPEDFRGPADLQRLPVLSRQEAVALGEELAASHLLGARRSALQARARRTVGRTSGSTGSPFRFHKDRAFSGHRAAHQAWRFQLAGQHPSRRHIKVWSRPFMAGAAEEVARHDPCACRLSLNSAPARPAILDQHLEWIRRFAPALVMAPPSYLHLLARRARRGRRPAPHFPAAISAYEQLHRSQRAAVEREFGCEVFDYYTSEEGLIQAMECQRHKGLHIDIRLGVLEVVDEAGKWVPPGRTGRMVCTGFFNQLMPLVRLDLGDLGALDPEPCSCGRGLPLLCNLRGRTSDVLTVMGRPLYPATLSVLLEEQESIAEGQFQALPGGGLGVNIVPADSWSPRDERRLRHTLRREIHAQLEPVIRLVDRIPRTRAGKFQLVIRPGEAAS